MTDSLGPHEPSPEFRAHLQWQIETALRRESRLAAPVGTGVQRRRTVLALLAALALGGAAGVASGHVQDARQRTSLVESVQGEMQLAQTRLALAQAEYRDVKDRYDIGMAGRESVRAAEQQLRAMEMELARLQLDMIEIQATAASPRNDLDAPLVSGRDFVRDRLHLALEMTQRAMVSAEERVTHVKGRVAVGTLPQVALTEAQADLSSIRAEMEILQARLDLRRRFLEGEIQQEQLFGTLRRTELLLAMQRAQQAITLARERVSELRGRAAVGVVAELEVKRAEVDLLEREIELQRLQRELAALKSAKER